ncbi:MAG TPA: phage tail protein [Pyrinomonadaceae bacterium]|nr:phage tail protein [Pyrinomonadaceae bacterium]
MARNDPYKNFNFLVDAEGLTAGFMEVSGLGAEVDVIEYREGGDSVVRKLPGLTKFPNVTLKRGVTNSAELFQWFKTVMDGQVQRRNCTIVLLDDARVPVVRWRLSEAWPRKYEGPDLKATGNEVAIESLEICYEYLEREQA